MYRLIILFLFSFCWTLTDVHAADYEINLSVLNALGQENMDQQLPIPNIETPKIQKKTIENPVKKTTKKVKKKNTPKVVKKIETPKKEIQGDILPKVVVAKEVKEQKTPVTNPVDKSDSPNGNDIKENKTLVIKPIIEQKTEASKAGATAEVVSPIVPIVKQSATIKEETPADDGMEEKSTTVSFADDSDELNEEIIRRLNLTVEKIGRDYSGKFLIEAYNYDNDGGIFSRKRLSLNRAVAVRSYLLGEGYKSFSIKIINTEDASLRNNVLISY